MILYDFNDLSCSYHQGNEVTFEVVLLIDILEAAGVKFVGAPRGKAMSD